MRPALLVPVVLLPLLAGCTVESPDCTPTTTRADDATKVDLRGLRGSSVLTGRLTESESGKAVGGATVTVTLRNGGDELYSATATTTSGGRVAYDLKGRLSVEQTLALARADGFGLSFDPQRHYCSSSDEARFRTLRT